MVLLPKPFTIGLKIKISDLVDHSTVTNYLAYKTHDILATMKKRIISGDVPVKEELAANWLDLEKLSTVEITSEDSEYPIERALLPDRNQGWNAGSPGTQTIRLLFNQPQDIRRIQLGFMET
jgi:hypothetical protein